MEIKLTQEEIQKSISAAFDSVNLINQLTNQKENSLDLTQEKIDDIINRNIEHLKIMMSKKWFTEALTDSQKEEINSIIRLK